MNTLKPNDIVEHLAYGVGTVSEEWGVFHTCRNCYAEVPIPKGKWMRTKCCDDYALQVSGEGIYDVAFKDKTHSINQLWLRKLPT